MVNLNAAMFANERDAGGLLKVRCESRVPYEQLWLCGGMGKHGKVLLLAKITMPHTRDVFGIATWGDTEEVATCIAESIEFVGRKKREPVTELWCNDLASDDLALALSIFANPECAPDAFDAEPRPSFPDFTS